MDGNSRVKDTNAPTFKLCLNDVHTIHGNTTNLLSHLKNNHPEQYWEVNPSRKASSTQNDKSQITIEDCIVRTKLINTGSSEYKQITNGITHCLAKDMLLISIVDKHGCHDMIKWLNPRCQLPHKDYFSCHAIPALYAEVFDQMEKKLKTDMV